MAELFLKHRILPPKTGRIFMILSTDRLCDYTPWKASALSSRFPDFAGRADEYLDWMQTKALPNLQNQFGP